MTQTAINYGKTLYTLGVSGDAVEQACEILEKVPQVGDALCSPVLTFQVKGRFIDRIFPKELGNFVKVVCRNQKADQLKDMLESYQAWRKQEEGILEARLYYANPPKKEQLEAVRGFLERTFGPKQVCISLREDKGLLGGFVLQAAGHEYDYSLRGRYRNLEQRLQRR